MRPWPSPRWPESGSPSLAPDPHRSFLLRCLSGTAEGLPTDPGWRWENFIAAASDELLLPAIYGLLQSAELLTQLPEEVRDFFFAAKELNRIRNRDILERVRLVAAALNRVGIEPLLLKGLPYLLTNVYTDWADRFLVDIDLLVARQQIPAALEVLQQLGYSFERSDPIDHATLHTFAVFSRADSMTIDLHQSMGLGASSAVLPVDAVLANSLVVPLEDAHVRIPGPEDLIAHHILHSQVHELYRDRIWTPLRSMYDLGLLQRCLEPAIDWRHLAARFKRNHLYGTLVLYLLQAERTAGFKSPIQLSLGPVVRLRWWRRQLLRRLPTARFVDPFWFYASGINPRTRRLREILNQPGGVRYLFRKLFSAGFFLRLKADLS